MQERKSCGFTTRRLNPVASPVDRFWPRRTEGASPRSPRRLPSTMQNNGMRPCMPCSFTIELLLHRTEAEGGGRRGDRSRIFYAPSNRDAPFGKKRPTFLHRNFTYVRGHVMLEMHLTAIVCITISLTSLSSLAGSNL
jgi:hypothetical protein